MTKKVTVSAVRLEDVDAADQNDLMEEYVEARSMQISEDVFRSPRAMDAFLDATGLREHLESPPAPLI